MNRANQLCLSVIQLVASHAARTVDNINKFAPAGLEAEETCAFAACSALTACPGGACYVLLDGFRTEFSQEGGPKIYGGWPVPSFMDGSPQVGYEPITIPFSFTEAMQWTLTIQDEQGALMLRADGAGEDGSVSWDGTVGGVPVPIGVYTARIDAVPESGAQVPRFSLFSFRVGFQPPFRDDEGSIHEPDIVTISDVGITITNGLGATIMLAANTVDFNSGALTII